MKKVLRTLALAAVVAAPAMVNAQDAPTVTKNWAIENNTSVTSFGKNDMRFGTGFGGKVFTNNKATGTIWYFDAEGAHEYLQDNALMAGCAVGCDDAGNLMVNKDFPSAGSVTKWSIIDPEKNITAVEFAIDEESGLTAKRLDQIGRVLGNVLSDEGGVIYYADNGASNVGMLTFQNGEYVPDMFDFVTCDLAGKVTSNTSAVVQPYFDNMAELLDNADEAYQYFYIRNRSAKTIWDYSTGEGVACPTPVNAHTQDGFDVFTLGDHTYFVHPAKNTANYEPTFVIINENGEELYKSDYTANGDGSQSFGSFVARKVSPYKVELYQYYVAGTGVVAAMYTISIPEPAAPSVYLAGTMNSWNAAEPVEMTLNNGVYEYTFAQDIEFKLSLTKGEGWTEFNAGVLGIAANATVLEPNKAYTLEAGKEGNLATKTLNGGKLVFDLNNKTLTVVGEAVPEEPLKAFYITGAITESNWDPQNPVEFALENEKFVATVTFTGTNFKMSTAKGDWNTFNAGAYQITETLADGLTLKLAEGSSDCYVAATGEYTLTVDPVEKTISAKKNPIKPVIPEHIYVHGTVKDNVWTANGVELTAAGEGIYTGTVEFVAAENNTLGYFRLAGATGDWDAVNGTQNFGPEENNTLLRNMMVEEMVVTTNCFTITPGVYDLKLWMAEGELALMAQEVVVRERNHFAHTISLNSEKEGEVDVTFHSTGNVDNTTLVLTPVTEGAEVRVPMGAAVKGVNTFKYNTTDLEADAYRLAIEFQNPFFEEYAEVYSEAAPNTGRGGVVVITDPEYDSFGKVMVSYGNAYGFDYYDAHLNKLATAQHSGAPFATGNASSCFRGAERYGKAVFVDYSNTATGGWWTLDPDNFETAPESLIQDYAGTHTEKGMHNVDGVDVGGAVAGVAFYGNGSQQKMISMVEQLSADQKNVICRYDIGYQQYLTEAPTTIFNELTSAMINHNCDFAMTDNGFFTAQVRGNADEAGVVRFVYSDLDGDIKYSAYNDVMPTSNGSVAYFAPMSLLAVGTYAEINVYYVDFNDQNVPTLEKMFSIPFVANFAQLKFDHAGNLHAVGQKLGYKVFAMPYAEIATSPAKSSLNITKVGTGVENIELGKTAGNEVYYNLNGTRVNGKPANGLYIKVVDGKATKTLVK